MSGDAECCPQPRIKGTFFVIHPLRGDTFLKFGVLADTLSTASVGDLEEQPAFTSYVFTLCQGCTEQFMLIISFNPHNHRRWALLLSSYVDRKVG